MIDCCAAMGAEVLCGPFYQPLGVFSGLPPSEEEKERAAEVHRRAADAARDAGLVMAVESLNRFECYLLNTIAQTQAIVEAVNRPNVGILFDTHHANIEESDLTAAISKASSEINHVHISESHRGTPGTGQVNWAEVFTALARQGYDDWLTVEAFDTQDGNLAKAANVWRNAFTSEKQLVTDAISFIRQYWSSSNEAA